MGSFWPMALLPNSSAGQCGEEREVAAEVEADQRGRQVQQILVAGHRDEGEEKDALTGGHRNDRLLAAQTIADRPPRPDGPAPLATLKNSAIAVPAIALASLSLRPESVSDSTG